MYGKFILLISGLALGGEGLASEAPKKGHSHSHEEGQGKATGGTDKIAPAPKPAVAKEISTTGAAAKCKPHKATKSACFICDASLRDKGRLWCKEHARYEDRCFLCHPEIKEEKRLWCKEHSLYEDECFLCHPELKKAKATGSKDVPAKGAPAPAQTAKPKKG